MPNNAICTKILFCYNKCLTYQLSFNSVKQNQRYNRSNISLNSRKMRRYITVPSAGRCAPAYSKYNLMLFMITYQIWFNSVQKIERDMKSKILLTTNTLEFDVHKSFSKIFLPFKYPFIRVWFKPPTFFNGIVKFTSKIAWKQIFTTFLALV